MRWLVSLFLGFVVSLTPLHDVWGVASVQLDQTFGGKGAGKGGFGEKLRLHVAPDGTIYVSDQEAQVVQKLSVEGVFEFQIPADPQAQELFRQPGDVCTDDVGNIYVTDHTARHLEDTDDPRIYVFTPCVYQFSAQGERLNVFYIDDIKVRPKTVLPVKLMLDEEGHSAYAIQPELYDRELRVDWSPEGHLYVLDIQQSTVVKFDRDGTRVKQFGQYGAGEGEMDAPADLDVDAQGNIWIADTGNHRILKFSPDGEMIFATGRKGRGNDEFIKPQAIATTPSGMALVKDSSQYKKALYSSPLYGPIQVGVDEPGSKSYLFGPQGRSQEANDLATRLRILEEAEYLRYLDETTNEGDEADAEWEAQRLRRTLYHNVIERVQMFDGQGSYQNRILYRIDKTSQEEHDLNFLALDGNGNIYLRDASEFTIHRYRTTGFGLQGSAMDTIYTTRAQNGDNRFIEDYEDIDLDPDIDDEENLFGWQQHLLFNYDVTERWNLALQNETVYNERDNRYVTDPKPEDSFTYSDEGWDNVLDLNLRYVTNPNPYRYKELNLYAQRLDGSTDGRSEAILRDRNQQRTEGTGEAQSYVFGLDWDIFRNTHFAFEYMDLDPDQTARNYTRVYYDVSGDLHERFRSESRARVWAAELTISF